MKRHRSQLTSAFVLLCMLMFVGVGAPDHKRADSTTPLPFEPAEELTYEGEISRGLLRGIDIADLHFTAERTPADTKTGGAVSRLRFTAETVTKGIFRKL